MFRSKIKLEEYLMCVQHKDTVGEDMSLDDIGMIPNLKEEEVKTIAENIFESRVSINMNASLVTIPDDFKNDKEVLIIDYLLMVLRNLVYVPLTIRIGAWSHSTLEVEVNRKILKSIGKRVRGFKYCLRCKYVKEDTAKEALYNLEKSKDPSAIGDQMCAGLVDYFFSVTFQDIATDIVKRKTGALEVAFSEAILSTETFGYHKLMGPESGRRGDDVEDNQKNNTLLAGEIENCTALRDKGGAAHALTSPHVLEQPNSLQGVKKSNATQISKKHISVTNRMENSTIGMPQPHNLVNQIPQSNVTI
ncbi:hypothetical protein Cgig2_024551 [Carnegiea gigantea]|uniref:Uncharacterized protein n=1 Tax=Carnegiea gigantea TaxID=171969 RepID=A0A9Q1JTI8_9CARY|nr:hypothetical protein Cgig2_024551 [Carnegiea gigantea]